MLKNSHSVAWLKFVNSLTNLVHISGNISTKNGRVFRHWEKNILLDLPIHRVECDRVDFDKNFSWSRPILGDRADSELSTMLLCEYKCPLVLL